MLTECDICPLTKLVLEEEDVLGPPRRLKPLKVGPLKSLAFSLMMKRTVKLSPTYTDFGACTVISCAIEKSGERRKTRHVAINILNLLLFVIFPIVSLNLSIYQSLSVRWALAASTLRACSLRVWRSLFFTASSIRSASCRSRSPAEGCLSFCCFCCLSC